ncbi:MAG: hypothetical protein K1X54_12710 [Flavobacteriales bacterium]|nr:hypothetical protein [Flavobacteriales bacterium]
MHIAFIIHGRKKKKATLQGIIDPLLRQGDHAIYLETTHSSHGTTLTQQCYADADVIVPVGGDGLFHECLIGMMQAQVRLSGSISEKVMIPWPCGSGNDFARNYSWKDDVHDVMRRIYSQQNMMADVGQVMDQHGNITYFLNELSLGLGPEVVHHVNRLPAHWSGGLKFGWGVIKAFFTFRKKQVDVSWGHTERYQGKAMAFVMANGKYFGSGLGIAPTADPHDGQLNITIIGNVSLLDYFLQIGKLKSCRPIKHPQVTYAISREIEILSRVALEADGELCGEGPVRIQLLPGVIQLR